MKLIAKFSTTVQEIIECYISNLILEFNNEYFTQIQLSNLIIEDAFEFDYVFDFIVFEFNYVFDSYCM